MNPLSQILNLCERVIEARGKAFPGKWSFNVSTLRQGALWLDDLDGRLYIEIEKGTNITDWRASGTTQFIADAANTSEPIARALKVAIEALMKYESTPNPAFEVIGSADSGIGLPVATISFPASGALTEISTILKGVV